MKHHERRHNLHCLPPKYESQVHLPFPLLLWSLLMHLHGPPYAMSLGAQSVCHYMSPEPGDDDDDDDWMTGVRMNGGGRVTTTRHDDSPCSPRRYGGLEPAMQ